jgi:hypothetical protein
MQGLPYCAARGAAHDRGAGVAPAADTAAVARVGARHAVA